MQPLETTSYQLPPSPLTFQRFLLEQASEQGLSATEPVGAVLLKMSKDLRVMPMVQFHRWYIEKHELMTKAIKQQGIFVYGQTLLDTTCTEELHEMFCWKDPYAGHRPVNLLQ